MLAANHGQNSCRGCPPRSSSRMTLMPLSSMPPACSCVAALPAALLPGLLARFDSSRSPAETSRLMINLPRIPDDQAERARGALYGLAIGDALGMPTQLLSRPEIVARYGPLLTGFEPAPDRHPIAAGHPAGAITDDTEQAVLLGRLLVAGQGTVHPGDLAAALVAWEADMKARGSLDLLGPSTRPAVAGVPGGHPPRPARPARQ